MKALLSIILSIALLVPVTSDAQSYEVQRLLLDIEKLSQLKQILNDLYKGYQILNEGYTTIKNISEGNFNLHEAFLDALLQVSPIVKNYKKVMDIVDYQKQIISEYKSSFEKIKNGHHFNADELAYMSSVYSKLVVESLKDLENLLNIVSAGKLRMSDDDRLRGIDNVYEHMKEKLMFLRHFNGSAAVLAVQRSREANDEKSIRNFYGF